MATTASNQHRCVFVGNIPYDTSEEQLIEICSEVGPVVSFRLVLDRETGKPKGYGFCEYKDEETALSARRNLQGYEINGRQLRVDFAENDKGVDRSRDQGRGAPGSTSTNYAQKALPRPQLPTDSSVNQPIGHSLAATAASHMARSLGGPQTSGLVMQNGLQNNMGLGNDPLTYYLANMSRQQINEIMAELKTLVVRNKPLAQQLLQECPQLLKAIFQAQIMLGMVPPHMMQTANTRPSSSSIPQSNIQNNLQTQNQLPPPYPMPNPTIPPQPSIPVQNTSVQSPFQPPNRPGITIMPPAHGSLPAQIPPLQVLPPNNQTFGPPMVTSAGIYSHPPIQNSHPPPIQNSHPPPIQNSHPPSIQNSHQHSYLPPPPMTSQTGPSNCPPLPIGPNAPSNDVGSYASTSHETFDSINNQSKRQKLEAISNFPINSSVPPQPMSINPIPGDETSSVQPSESQNPHIQLPEVELTLLQQVMKITPEQLSSLPLEQQQQVIQLQQMLAKQNL